MLSISTDFHCDGTGDPSPYLRRIADAGFSHVHWCHEYWTDYLYTQSDIKQIRGWLDAFGLRILDLHGSSTDTAAWTAVDEQKRRAGVALLKNRLAFVAELADPGGSVVMHLGMAHVGVTRLNEPGATQARRSLDELEDFCRERGVFIALENSKNFAILRHFLAAFGPEFVGLCYDSGHGNLATQHGLDNLDDLKDRLIALHLHDNDSTGDYHQPMFMGTVDWDRLARIVARSAYTGCVSQEISMEFSGTNDEPTFLARAFENGTRFTEMIAHYRKVGAGS